MKEDTWESIVTAFGSMTQHTMLCIVCIVIFIIGMFAGMFFYHIDMSSDGNTVYTRYIDASQKENKCLRTLSIVDDRPCCTDLINISIHHAINHHTNFNVT